MTRKTIEANETRANPRLTYRTADAAEALDVSEETVRRLVRSKTLRCLPGIRHMIIPASELNRFLAEVSAR